MEWTRLEYADEKIKQGFYVQLQHLQDKNEMIGIFLLQVALNARKYFGAMKFNDRVQREYLAINIVNAYCHAVWFESS